MKHDVLREKLELVLALRWELRISPNSDHGLSPSLSIHQILQSIRHTFQSFVDMLEDGRSDLLCPEHIKQCFPCLTDLVRFIANIGTPVNTGHGDVLEQDKVGGDLLDCTGCETNDDDSSVPSNDFEGRDDHSNGIVDYVYSVAVRDFCVEKGG